MRDWNQRDIEEEFNINIDHVAEYIINVNSNKVYKYLFKFNKIIIKYNKYRSKHKSKKYMKKLKQLNFDDFSKLLTVLLENQFYTAVNVPMVKLSKKLSIKKTVALDYLAIASHANLCDIEATMNGCYIVSALSKKMVDNPMLKRKLYGLSFMPPMVVVPNEIGIHGSPYLTFKTNLILKFYDHEKTKNRIGDNYDVLDKLNSIPLVLADHCNYKEELKSRKYKNKFKKKVHKQLCKESEMIYNFVGKNTFYHVWKFDYRGRMYAQGRHINFHGDDYKRSCIRLRDPKILDETGIKWVQINMANLWGHGIDKLPFAERRLWAETRGMEVNWKKADDPYQFREMRKVLQNPSEPTNILASVDATSSGTQILAVAAKCKKSMKACNVLGEEFSDAPMIVLNRFNKINKGKKLNIDRKIMKDTLVQSIYGSVKKPEDTFVTTKKIKAYYKSIKVELPGVYKVLSKLHQCIKPRARSYKFKTADGFKVVVKVKNKVSKRIVSDVLGLRITHVTIKHRPSRSYVGIMANITHAEDAWVMRNVIRICDFRVLPIHDAMYAHPNDLDKVCDAYRASLQKSSDELHVKKIIKQLGVKLKVSKKKIIINGKYAAS